ncbi:hypothetical protein TBLA_0E04310 [Henningerozyma blattae CBS 6284]|uniref:RING-type domain-containing protein n=1 Tax=Henningerozyma blattae (strain ATCC 34711 / CBS 6284 / DSM 70876 / NBRC 10599 / NRRL Y-10934 / UCD 77-7) TaxID=1071380 RepID=I2H533_HENB6|nr:hypothetical protein TBLA_0E04310 [Tetrapisispora blattae CBS 6284]CCH61485.1 hypothetical protein TBLA_0E04310 [Tetrapisispora blattae CBS 6284]
MNPLHTPELSSTSQFGDSTSSSSSSKGRKWTQKFNVFQSSSEKKKKSSSSSPLSHNLTRSISTEFSFQRSKTDSSGISTQIISSPIGVRPLTNNFNNSISNNNSSYNLSPTSTTNSRISSPNLLPLRTSPVHSEGHRISSQVNPTPGRNNSIANKPIVTKKLITDHPQFITRSDSMLLLRNNSYSPTQGRFGSTKKSFTNEVCTLCEEPVTSRARGEKIIELECGHLIHNECLSSICEDSVNTDTSDIYSIFPDCTKCKYERNVEMKCIPKDNDTKDSLISNFLIKQNSFSRNASPLASLNYSPNINTITHSPFASRSQNITPKSPPLAPNNRIMAQTITRSRSPTYLHAPRLQSSIPFNISNNSHLSRSSSKGQRIPNSREFTPVSGRRGSNYSLAKSVLSSTSIPPRSLRREKSRSIDTKHSKIKIPLALLRSYYIQFLSNNFSAIISDWEIDQKFGLLRLVDKLQISIDDQIYVIGLCFLFEKTLITTELINDQDDPSTITEDSIINYQLKNIKIYHLVEDNKIETIKSSGLKCTINSQKIYLNESSKTDSSEVIQKWISALLDHNICFTEESFSSTLPVPSVIQNFDECNPDSNTISGILNPNKVIQVQNMDDKHNSVLIRRGFNLEGNSNTIQMTDIGTLQSIVTNVSLMVSLKRDCPEKMVLVLQLKDNTIPQETSRLIFNTIFAVRSRLSKMQITIVNEDAMVIYFGEFLDKLDEFNKLLVKDSSNNIKFSPSWLKKQLNLSAGSTDNTAIAIVSEAAMKKGSSCLLMDYSPFAAKGKRIANEVKIKVGYLNVDYTDQITELVEVGGWKFVLEMLCYSFSLNFEDDDDESYSEVDSDIDSKVSIVRTLPETNIGDENDSKSPTETISTATIIDVESPDTESDNVPQIATSPRSVTSSKNIGEIILDIDGFDSPIIPKNQISTPVGLGHLLKDIEKVIDSMQDQGSSNSIEEHNYLPVMKYEYM